MRNLEEKEIKQFSEFTEVTPESSQNLITDKGRFTVGALFSAVVAYATDLINSAVNSAVSGVQALINSAVDSATEETQAAKLQAEAARNIALGAADSAVQTAGVPALRLGKKNAPQLWLNGGKLSVPDWPSVVLPLPFSLAIEYEVESWDGISYEYNNEFSFFNCTNADWDASGYPIYGFRLTKNGESTLGFTLGGCGGEGMGASRGWSGNITLPTGRHTLAVAVPAPDASGNSPASIPVYIDGENAGSLFATVGKHNASVSFQRPLVINERGVYAGGATFNEFEIALSRISVFNFDMSAEDAPYTIADYAAGKLIPPALKPSQVSLALENYTIARNSTTTLVKDASGNSYDATVTGSVAGDNDQSVKAFVDEIKTQINQSNG